MNSVFSWLFLLILAATGTLHGADQVWRYQLLEGSTFTDDCPICDRIPIVVPMRGTFQLRLLEDRGRRGWQPERDAGLLSIGLRGKLT